MGHKVILKVTNERFTKLEQAKKNGDAAKVAFYEAELILLSIEDYVVH